MGEPMASETAIQVLTERVGNALDDLKEMKGQISSVQQALIVMASMQEKISHVDGKTARLFTLADDTQKQIGAAQAQVKQHTWMWKLLGTGLVACLGAIGWAAAQYQDFQRLTTKVAIIERMLRLDK